MRYVTWAAVLFGWVALIKWDRLPEVWAAQIQLPLLLGLFTIGLGVATACRCSSARHQAAADAEIHRHGRQQPGRRTALRGYFWALATWLLVAAGPFGLLFLDRLRLAAVGSLSPFPLAGALVYPAGLFLAFALAFRRQTAAGAEAIPRREWFKLSLLAGAPVILLESLPRSLDALDPHSALWLLRPPGLPAPAAGLSALLAAGLVIAGGLLLREASREPSPQGTAELLAAAGTKARMHSTLDWLKAGLLALGFATLSTLWWRAYTAMNHDLSAEVLGLPMAGDSYLAVSRTTAGAVGLASFIQGDKAYVSMVDGIGIYDISDPARPRMIQRLHVQSGTNAYGFDAKFFEGPHGVVYVRLSHSLWAMDWRDPIRPSLANAGTNDLVMANGQTYGWFWNGGFGRYAYRLDARNPYALRPREELPRGAGEEIFAMLPAAAQASRHEDLVVVVNGVGQGPRSLQILLLTPGKPIRRAEGGLTLPTGADLLAVKDGIAYVLTGSNSLQVMALDWGEDRALTSTSLAQLDLGAASGGSEPDDERAYLWRTNIAGQLREGRLLFVSRHGAVMTLVDVSDPHQPRLLAEDRSRRWGPDLQWSPDGLVSALSLGSSACPYAVRLADAWHLLRVEASGTLRHLASRPSAVYRHVARAGAKTWALAECRGIRAIGDGFSVTKASVDQLRDTPVLEHESGARRRLKGSQVGFWVHGDRWCRTVDDGVSCQDRSAARRIHFGGTQVQAPVLAAASERYLVVTHVGGVLVLDLGQPQPPGAASQPIERQVLDWADPDFASQPELGSSDWRQGYYEPGPWADLVEGHLLVVSDGGTLFRWRLGAWDQEPQVIPLPASIEPSSKASLPPSARRSEASWDHGARLLIEDLLPRPLDKSAYGYYAHRILDLRALPKVVLRPCTFGNSFVALGQSPEWAECDGLLTLAAMIQRQSDGQALQLHPIDDFLLWLSGVGQGRRPTALGLEWPTVLTDAALVSAHEAVVVTEQGDLLHVERRPVVGRFIDALLGRVVPQE